MGHGDEAVDPRGRGWEWGEDEPLEQGQRVLARGDQGQSSGVRSFPCGAPWAWGGRSSPLEGSARLWGWCGEGALEKAP